MEELRVEFIQLEIFSRQLDRVGEPGLLTAIEQILLSNPEAGVLLRGGMRKIRVPSAARALGKRGGYRVWHYYYQLGERIYLLYLHDKRDGQNIAPDIERQLLAALQLIQPQDAR